MIGISLNKCVAAICRGEVKLEDVEKIISRTIAMNEMIWDEVIHEYRNSYWADFPDRAEEIARRFLSEGRIEQPLLSAARRCPDVSKGIWVKSEKDIKWIYVG